MKPLKTFCKWVVLLPVFFLFIGCACQKYTLEPGATETAGTAKFLNFPQSYRLVHKVRLSVRGMTFDFIGYLAINGACCRAVAVSEVGGTLFDLLSCNGLRKIIKNPGRIPKTSLKRGVLSELGYLFGHPDRQDAVGRNTRLTAGPDSGVNAKPGIIHENTGSGRTLLLIQDDCLLSEITIHSFRTVPDWPHPIPDKFRIQNKHWGYVMDVELLRMDMRTVEKSVFEIAEEN